MLSIIYLLAPLAVLFHAPDGQVAGVHAVDLPDAWLTQPSAQLARSSIPIKSGQFAMVEFRCTGFKSDGHLEGCATVRVEPSGEGYEEAGQRLISQYIANQAFKVKAGDHLVKLAIQLRLWNSNPPDLLGPCWEPSCVLNPKPPMPPPPPPQF